MEIELIIAIPPPYSGYPGLGTDAKNWWVWQFRKIREKCQEIGKFANPHGYFECPPGGNPAEMGKMDGNWDTGRKFTSVFRVSRTVAPSRKISAKFGKFENFGKSANFAHFQCSFESPPCLDVKKWTQSEIIILIHQLNSGHPTLQNRRRKLPAVGKFTPN